MSGRYVMLMVAVMLLVGGCKEQSGSSSKSSGTSNTAQPATPAPAASAASQPANPMANTRTELPAGHPPINNHPPMQTPTNTSQPTGSQPVSELPQPWVGDELAWVVPAGWSMELASGMRFASIKNSNAAEPIEIAVSRFPGDVGGMLANVNRWRGQIGMPAVTEAELPQMNSPLPVGDIAATLTDITNTQLPPQQMLSVTIPHAGQTWFIKMVGPAERVAQYRTDFLTFSQSIRFSK
ncbi:MAG: hypothetical protein HJJLKODD_00601 [Phycisphaerae bacterium]|nr:hypothetical protein [Phycisphaerae bacterium]